MKLIFSISPVEAGDGERWVIRGPGIPPNSQESRSRAIELTLNHIARKLGNLPVAGQSVGNVDYLIVDCAG